MNKYIAVAAAAGALVFGSGVKKVYDIAKNEKVVLEQSEQLNQPAVVETKDNKTITGIFINRKGIESWLRNLQDTTSSYIGATDTKIVPLPRNNNVSICSGYGCKFIQKYHFTDELLNSVKSILDTSTNADEERANLVSALALIKTEVGLSTNTATDKPGEPFLGNGRKDQMSVMDETANTTQYLYILADSGFIKFHHLNKPETGKYLIGTVSSITDVATNKHYNVTYDGEGKPVIIAR